MTQKAWERAKGLRPLRVGVLGARGQLGQCLLREIEAHDELELAFAATRDEIDMSEPARVPAFLDRLAGAPPAEAPATPAGLPDLVVNAAAHTKVDACETEADLAWRVNADAPGAWARALAERGVAFLHVSTDYVFSGDVFSGDVFSGAGKRPYREDDPTQPHTVYGASKRAGEIAVLGAHPKALVVRTSWVFGPGRNFVVAVLEQARKRRAGELEGPLRVVDDQHGSPTSAADLAGALLRLGLRMDTSVSPPCGLLHLRNAGETTWYGFAREALDQAGYADIRIEPVPTSAFPTVAPRPAYSVLDCSRARSWGIELRPWPEALAGYLSSSDWTKLPGSEARHGARASAFPSVRSDSSVSERRSRSAKESPG